MQYSLIVFFLATGDGWVEQRHLPLQACAGQAAMSRQAFIEVLPKLNKRLGPFYYFCVPERESPHSD